MPLAPALQRVAAALSVVAASLAAVMAPAAPALAANQVLGPHTQLYLDPASSTLRAAATLSGQARADAQLLGSFPSATWFTHGTPAEVQARAGKLVDAAAERNAVPTLVAYNLPFRDCSQYSAGGAAHKTAYKAWIDGLAAGIGNRKVVVILEPDGLGIIPFHAALDGKAEWCRPAEADPATAASDRYEQLNHAVDKLKANPNAAVYLDGTHSGWLGVGDIASRLVKAGVRRADGFFLNVSNYEPTAKNRDYGYWISQCIHYANNPAEDGKRLGHYEHCASQHHPATADDYSTWGLSRQWYIDNVALAANPPSGPGALAHFVIDTSRNGQGAWAPPAGTRHPDPQTWCNPPDRGLGQPPTTRTGNPLVDAYLWIKTPGESDGQCDRGTGTGTDPARGYANPAAGGWFVEQAAELIALANPGLARPTCHVQYGVSDLWPGGFNAKVGIRHTGAAPIDGWTLGWTFSEGQAISLALDVHAAQSGRVATASSVEWNKALAPGASLNFQFIGKGDGAGPAPLAFTLNGAPCTLQ
jgi:endoglucanase